VYPEDSRFAAPCSCTVCRRSQDDAEEGYQEAEAALEIMEEAEAEEAELEEVEDLLEYYLQRATTTQSEAERLLAGSRDLEESIGVSLSARRFEVSPCFMRWWFIVQEHCVYITAGLPQQCLDTLNKLWHGVYGMR